MVRKWANGRDKETRNVLVGLCSFSGDRERDVVLYTPKIMLIWKIRRNVANLEAKLKGPYFNWEKIQERSCSVSHSFQFGNANAKE